MKQITSALFIPFWRGSKGGFSLGEVMIAILCLGLLLAPFLRTVTNLPAMQRQLGLEARDEAWRTFQDHALASGIDPQKTMALMPGLNPAIPAVESEVVARGLVVPLPGTVGLRVISITSASIHPEDRPGGAGWELSRGLALDPVAAPAPSLLPVTLQMPEIYPLPGLSLPLTALTIGAESVAPFLLVKASSPELARVCLQNNQSGLPSSGLGKVESAISLEQFAAGFRGTAWAEYPGEPTAGHQSVEMPDGRKRWLVPEGRGVRIYEPSEILDWSYKLDLGLPILRFAGAEISAGESLVMGFEDLMAVSGGLIALRIDWPDTTRSILGPFAHLLNQGFEISFAGSAGPANGDLGAFCMDSSLGLWSEECLLRATPQPAPGFTAGSASWVLVRGLTAMGEPELVAADGNEPNLSPDGTAQFAPPTQADGVRRGRLSARNGSLVSTTSSLSLTIVP